MHSTVALSPLFKLVTDWMPSGRASPAIAPLRKSLRNRDTLLGLLGNSNCSWDSGSSCTVRARIALNPSVVAQRVGTPTLTVGVWVLGGGYVYLRDGFGALPAFLYGS